MKILGLPGINPVTEQWMNNLFGILDLGQQDSSVQKYRCWQTPGTRLDLGTELARAGKEQADVIIAKSIGTVLALHGFKKGLLAATEYIFIGVPVRGMGENEKSMLREFIAATPRLLFIQQADDKAGSVNELRNVIANVAPVEIVGIPGNDHMYSDIHQLKNIIESWISDTAGYTGRPTVDL